MANYCSRISFPEQHLINIPWPVAKDEKRTTIREKDPAYDREFNIRMVRRLKKTKHSNSWRIIVSVY
jgi:hypothetical protein